MPPDRLPRRRAIEVLRLNTGRPRASLHRRPAQRRRPAAPARLGLYPALHQHQGPEFAGGGIAGLLAEPHGGVAIPGGDIVDGFEGRAPVLGGQGQGPGRAPMTADKQLEMNLSAIHAANPLGEMLRWSATEFFPGRTRRLLTPVMPQPPFGRHTKRR